MNDETIQLTFRANTSDVTDATAKLKTLETAATTAGNRIEDAGKRASSGMAGVGQAVMQSSRAIQDFAQGGIGGVLNNIEGLAFALGGGAGLAGALTIAGVAIYAFGGKIKELLGEKTLEVFASRTEELNAKIKELEGKDVKVAIDWTEISRAKAEVKALESGLNALNALLGKQTDAERMSGEGVMRALTDTEANRELFASIQRTEAERQGLADPRVLDATKELFRRDEQYQRMRRAAEMTTGSPEEQAARMEAAERALQAREKALGDYQMLLQGVTDAASARIGELTRIATQGVGPAQMQAQADLASLLRAGGGGGLAEQIRMNSPEIAAGAIQGDIEAARVEEANERWIASQRKKKAEADAARREQEARDNAAIDEEQRRIKESGDEIHRQRIARQKQAEADAALLGKGMGLDVQGAIAQHELAQASGMTRESDEAFRKRIEAEIARRAAPLAGADGKPIGDDAGRVAEELFGQQLTDITRRVTTMQASGMSQTEALIGIVQSLMSQVQELQIRDQRNAMGVRGLTSSHRSAALRGRP